MKLNEEREKRNSQQKSSIPSSSPILSRKISQDIDDIDEKMNNNNLNINGNISPRVRGMSPIGSPVNKKIPNNRKNIPMKPRKNLKRKNSILYSPDENEQLEEIFNKVDRFSQKFLTKEQLYDAYNVIFERFPTEIQLLKMESFYSFTNGKLNLKDFKRGTFHWLLEKDKAKFESSGNEKFSNSESQEMNFQIENQILRLAIVELKTKLKDIEDEKEKMNEELSDQALTIKDLNQKLKNLKNKKDKTIETLQRNLESVENDLHKYEQRSFRSEASPSKSFKTFYQDSRKDDKTYILSLEKEICELKKENKLLKITARVNLNRSQKNQLTVSDKNENEHQKIKKLTEQISELEHSLNESKTVSEAKEKKIRELSQKIDELELLLYQAKLKQTGFNPVDNEFDFFEEYKCPTPPPSPTAGPRIEMNEYFKNDQQKMFNLDDLYEKEKKKKLIDIEDNFDESLSLRDFSANGFERQLEEPEFDQESQPESEQGSTRSKHSEFEKELERKINKNRTKEEEIKNKEIELKKREKDLEEREKEFEGKQEKKSQKFIQQPENNTLIRFNQKKRPKEQSPDSDESDKFNTEIVFQQETVLDVPFCLKEALESNQNSFVEYYINKLVELQIKFNLLFEQNYYLKKQIENFEFEKGHRFLLVQEEKKTGIPRMVEYIANLISQSESKLRSNRQDNFIIKDPDHSLFPSSSSKKQTSAISTISNLKNSLNEIEESFPKQEILNQNLERNENSNFVLFGHQIPPQFSNLTNMEKPNWVYLSLGISCCTFALYFFRKLSRKNGN